MPPALMPRTLPWLVVTSAKSEPAGVLMSGDGAAGGVFVAFGFAASADVLAAATIAVAAVMTARRSRPWFFVIASSRTSPLRCFSPAHCENIVTSRLRGGRFGLLRKQRTEPGGGLRPHSIVMSHWRADAREPPPGPACC